MFQTVSTKSRNNLQINYKWKWRPHRATAPPCCAAANRCWFPTVLPATACPPSGRYVPLRPCAGCRTHCTDKINTTHIKLSQIKIMCVFFIFSNASVNFMCVILLAFLYSIIFQLIRPQFVFRPQKQGSFYPGLAAYWSIPSLFFDHWAYSGMTLLKAILVVNRRYC